ncbi:uncharacterized protein LOC144886718 [Branchiostoma floridae x Branchiostoma japonicum]
MPKVKRSPAAPGLTGVTIPGPTRSLIPRWRGLQAARDPQRNGRFWRPASTAVKLDFTPVYRRWLREGVPEEYKPDYGMGNLNAKIEEISGNALMLSGPLIDFHLTKIGEDVGIRLRRSSGTGLATFVQIVAPTAFSQMMLLMKRYGAEVNLTGGSGMYGTVDVTVKDLSTLNCIISGARSDGRSYTTKLHFDTERCPDNQVIDHYRGKTVVVVTCAKPFRMNYRSRAGKLTVTFYRQKYDRNGLAEDTVLQATA